MPPIARLTTPFLAAAPVAGLFHFALASDPIRAGLLSGVVLGLLFSALRLLLLCLPLLTGRELENPAHFAGYLSGIVMGSTLFYGLVGEAATWLLDSAPLGALAPWVVFALFLFHGAQRASDVTESDPG